jgi:hypothetical protein
VYQIWYLLFSAPLRPQRPLRDFFKSVKSKITLEKRLIILGINAYHADSSAAIFVDGKMIAAIEEERFKRVKHWAGFPRQAIEFCLKEARSSGMRMWIIMRSAGTPKQSSLRN